MLLEFNRCSNIAINKNMRGIEASHRRASRVVLLPVVVSFDHPAGFDPPAPFWLLLSLAVES